MPVAAIYEQLRDYHAELNPDVRTLLNELASLELQGLAQAREIEPSGRLRELTAVERGERDARYLAWLPNSGKAHIPVDEVGVFYALTPLGRSAVDSDGSADGWLIEEVRSGDTVALTVSARDVALAEVCLARWRKRHGYPLMLSGPELIAHQNIVLRSGETLGDAVQLRCAFKLRPPTMTGRPASTN